MIKRMMMKKSVLYAFITAMLTAVSCTNDIPANVTGDTSGNTSEDTSGSGSGDLSGNSGKISIVASIASQTRTPQLGSDGSGSFQKGDKMTLCVTGGAAPVVTDYALRWIFFNGLILDFQKRYHKLLFQLVIPHRKWRRMALSNLIRSRLPMVIC